MKNQSLRIWAALLLVMACHDVEAGDRAKSAPLVVYDDSLHASFENWSWGENDAAQTREVHAGRAALSLTPREWNALYFKWVGSSPLKVADHAALTLWVKASAETTQSIRVSIGDPGSERQYGREFQVEPGPWRQLRLEIAGKADLPTQYFDKIYVQSWQDQTAGKLFVDDVELVAPIGPAQPMPVKSLRLDFPEGADGGLAIADTIYGLNDLTWGDHDSDLPYPVKRWGGNHTTRYNFKQNASNSGKDWFYLNYSLGEVLHAATGRKLPYVDRLILSQIAADRQMLVTVPMAGWVAKDSEPRWGYPVKRFGPQGATESEQSKGDAGNGLSPQGEPLKKGDATLTSIRVGPDYVKEWLGHLRGLTGKSASQGGVRYYALDNEPSIWHTTHQDLRYGDPQLETPEVGFDEIWQRTVDYATAVKQADPAAKILGPVAWGWCDYHGFGRDRCEDGPDRRKHGGKPFLQWYMEQVCRHKAKTGKLLVDLLDIHYYPSSEEHFENESFSEQEKRLQAVRSLYDPAFVDGSWIQDPIELIPRMKRWIQQSCPDMGLAITEYRFGAARDGISSMLANAEALAIFGQQGVALATFWGHMPKGSLLEQAFRLYLDYDGKGSSALGGKSVKVASSLSGKAPAYGIRVRNKLLVYVFNKTREPIELRVSEVKKFKLARLFRVDGKGLGELGASGNGVVALPDLSVTLLEYQAP